jgi:hypothetical protein
MLTIKCFKLKKEEISKKGKYSPSFSRPNQKKMSCLILGQIEWNPESYSGPLGVILLFFL